VRDFLAFACGVCVAVFAGGLYFHQSGAIMRGAAFGLIACVVYFVVADGR